jgi:hypothetical protein
VTPKQVYVGVPVSALRSVSGEALDESPHTCAPRAQRAPRGGLLAIH